MEMVLWLEGRQKEMRSRTDGFLVSGYVVTAGHYIWGVGDLRGTGASLLYMYLYIVLLHVLDQRQVCQGARVSCNARSNQEKNPSHIHHPQKPPYPRNPRFAWFIELFCPCFDLENLSLKVRHSTFYVFDF